jgi:polyisoprenoid-binding protein YceI
LKEKYPFVIFESASITQSDDHQYLVTGELSLHGVSKIVTVRAVKTDFYRGTGGEYRSGFETRFSIKRSDYGMTYLTAVTDKVELFISVEGVRVENSMSSSGGLDYTFKLGCK